VVDAFHVVKQWMPQTNLPWRCATHGDPVAYGCIGCDAAQRRLAKVLADPRAPHADRLRAAELVLLWRAGDYTTSVAPHVYRRAVRDLKRAAIVFAAEVRRGETDRLAMLAIATPRQRARTIRAARRRFA
jgi:hypothetical protein